MVIIKRGCKDLCTYWKLNCLESLVGSKLVETTAFPHMLDLRLVWRASDTIIRCVTVQYGLLGDSLSWGPNGVTPNPRYFYVRFK